MFKENGMEKPADKSELAGLKGKHMVCPTCGEYVISKAGVFGSDVCTACGAKLIDVDMTTASKANGKE